MGIAIGAKIASNDGGTVCGLCGEKNPLGNLRRISIQDATEPGEILCFHRGRQILRDRHALKKLFASVLGNERQRAVSSHALRDRLPAVANS
jgi:hypothetical protein